MLREICMFVEYICVLASCYNHVRNANPSGSSECDASLEGRVLLMSLICPFCLADCEGLKLFDLSVWMQTTGMSDMFDVLLGKHHQRKGMFPCESQTYQNAGGLTVQKVFLEHLKINH